MLRDICVVFNVTLFIFFLMLFLLLPLTFQNKILYILPHCIVIHILQMNSVISMQRHFQHFLSLLSSEYF